MGLDVVTGGYGILRRYMPNERIERFRRPLMGEEGLGVHKKVVAPLVVNMVHLRDISHIAFVIV